MNGNTIFTYFSFTTKTITDWGYFKPFFFDKLGNSRISEVIKGKQYHWLYICLFKIIFWKFILNSNLNGDSCWIKVHNLFYLFILSYGHLDLLTSMNSYQDATKENMHKPTWNLVKILITGTIFFLLYPTTFNSTTGSFQDCHWYSCKSFYTA